MILTNWSWRFDASFSTGPSATVKFWKSKKVAFYMDLVLISSLSNCMHHDLTDRHILSRLVWFLRTEAQVPKIQAGCISHHELEKLLDPWVGLNWNKSELSSILLWFIDLRLLSDRFDSLDTAQRTLSLAAPSRTRHKGTSYSAFTANLWLVQYFLFQTSNLFTCLPTKLKTHLSSE